MSEIRQAEGARPSPTLALDEGRGAPALRGDAAPLLEVEHLSVAFELPEGDLLAVDDVSFTLGVGSTLGIAGESGSGKSAMARALLGLHPRARTRISGAVRLNGVDLVGLDDRSLRQRRGREVAMVFQDPMRSFNPIKTVGEQVAEAIRIHERVTRRAARDRVVELFSMVQLPNARDRYHSYPHQLSGGMRQRVMIAMALSCRPSLLVADEPTTALDVTTQVAIMTLLHDLQEQLGMAVIFITHDLNLAATYTHDVAVMYSGRIVERIASSDVFGRLRMPYAQALIGAMPTMDDQPHSRLATVEGRRPDPFHMPGGCAFHPRCAYATDECREAAPALVEGEPNHFWACFNPLEIGGAR